MVLVVVGAGVTEKLDGSLAFLRESGKLGGDIRHPEIDARQHNHGCQGHAAHQPERGRHEQVADRHLHENFCGDKKNRSRRTEGRKMRIDCGVFAGKLE